MQSKSTYFKKLMSNYDTTRMNNMKLLKQKKDYIYQEIPSIKAIDNELSQVGIKISKLILTKSEDKDRLIDDLQSNTINLIKKKKHLLQENGYTEDFLDLKYNCSICKDTGYIENNQCNCLKQKLIDFAYEQSNVKKIVSKENFKTFSFEYYSDQIDEQHKKSPRDQMKFVYNYVINFIKNFDQGMSNLLFYGETGLGKTFLSNCIAKTVLDLGHTVLYLTAFELFHIFEKYKFNHNEEQTFKEHFDSIFEVDLLIIDDLGTEFNTSLTGTELFNCLNTRILNNKSTIISTNLTPGEIKGLYSDRIASRIIGHYEYLKFFGSDIRFEKKYHTN